MGLMYLKHSFSMKPGHSPYNIPKIIATMTPPLGLNTHFFADDLITNPKQKFPQIFSEFIPRYVIWISLQAFIS